MGQGNRGQRLNNHFAMTIRRAIASTSATIQGVLITAVDFIPRLRQPWDAGEEPQNCL